MPSHFCICILPSERPRDAALLHITAQLPCIHFSGERGAIWQAPIKALVRVSKGTLVLKQLVSW